MFTPRTTPLTVGEQPWNWSPNCDSKFQCTWWAFYRCISLSYSPCCWYEGSGNDGFGSYTNAKDWLKNFRSPWEVKGLDYTPVAGDIVVYDGNYGHVQFMETDTMYSEYSSGNPDSFRNGKLSDYKGNILGYLHYPYNPTGSVERNVNVDQIQTLNDTLRIRTKPSLNGDIAGFVQLGYYNVLDKKDNDGYTWYKIDPNRWCANIDTIYLPRNGDDIIKEIEEYFNSMKDNINKLTTENKNMKEDMKKIDEISKRWI